MEEGRSLLRSLPRPHNHSEVAKLERAFDGREELDRKRLQSRQENSQTQLPDSLENQLELKHASRDKTEKVDAYKKHKNQRCKDAKDRSHDKKEDTRRNHRENVLRQNFARGLDSGHTLN